MNWKEWVEQSFHQAWESHHAKDPDHHSLKPEAVPFHRKALVATGVISVAALLGGCTDEDPTAYQECQWERETFGYEYDCEDDDSDFYIKKGYSGKKAIVSKSSPYYQTYKSHISTSKGGVGSGGIFGSGG